MGKISEWLEDRVGLGPLNHVLLERSVPVGTNWWYSLGAATLFVLMLQVVTGILLALNYVPAPDHAYDSVLFVTQKVPFGWIIRGLHHWGASAMVILVAAHMITAFVLGAFSYPREGTWVIGVLLLLLTLGFGFTGYLLPWDQKAYWATSVGTNMAGTAPVIGPALVRLMRGGTEVGAVTLTRFYSLHVLALPAMLSLFVLVHLVLVIWHGVSVRPGLWHRGRPQPGGRGEKPSPAWTAREAAMEPLSDAGVSALSPQAYRLRYEAFKVGGPRFWPNVIAEDSVVALIVFVVLLGLTVVFGSPTGPRADPTDTSYIPRPEWYFMFLFQLVKLFPGNLEWIGVVIVPGTLVLLLFLVPFLSGSRERRPWKRPVMMGALGVAVIGALVLTIQAYQTTPKSPPEQMVALTSQQLRGRQLVEQQGCRSCHLIGGIGNAVKGPALDGILERVTAADIHSFIEEPRRHNPAASMEPLIPPLSHQDVEAITHYVLTLPPKGRGVGSVEGQKP